MALDFVLKRARLGSDSERTVDIGIAGGRIAAIEPAITADCEAIEIDGALVMPGFVDFPRATLLC